MTDLYYVYLHVDPMTKDILYVGMGKGSRAYATKTTSAGKNEYGHRSPQHSQHLDMLMEKGFLPHEWVVFDKRGLSKERAKTEETRLIEECNPMYNRKFGRKLCLFNEGQVRYILSLRELGWTLSQIAFEMRCSVMVVSRICNGKSKNYKEMVGN